MSFPASLTTRTVKGRFVTYPAGTAAKGRVRIVLNDFMQGPTDNAFVAPFDETIPLDRNGEFSILLPATNDPQWTPSYYKITITIGEKIVRDKFQVSYDETDDLDLSDVLNLPAPTPGESYLLASSKGVAGGVAGLGSDGKVPANQLPPASGGVISWGDIEEKPATFPHDEVTYDQVTDKPDLFPPVAHDHPMSNIEGLTDALGTKANSEEVAQSLNHKADLVDGVLASWQLPVSNKADVGLGNVDNTSDADKPVSTAQQTALNLKAPLASPTFTGTVSGVSKAMVGLGNADNTSDANKPVSTAQQSALDLKANLASPTLTGAPSAPTATAGTNTTQLATTGFVTTAVAPKADASAVSTALAGKADLVGGVIPTSQIPALAINETYTVASQAAMLALTAQRGDVAVRTDFTPYHLFFLASDSPGTLADWKEITAAGSVVTVNGQSGVVVLAKSDIGLGSVDNTADTAKPISTAQQTALDAKAFAGYLPINGNVAAGVDPTGATECSAALQTLFDAYAQSGDTGAHRIVRLQGIFNISSTIVIKGSVDASAAIFNYSGSDVAIRIGNSAAGNLTRLTVNIGQIICTGKTGTGWLAGSMGLVVTNLFRSTITFQHIKHFETGLAAVGDDRYGFFGTSYCRFEMGALNNNKVNLLIDRAVGSGLLGYSTQNTYVGGSYAHAEGTYPATGQRHIQIGQSGTILALDNNLFLNPSLEGSTEEYLVDCNGSNNLWLAPRFEFVGNPPPIRWGAQAYRNLMVGGVGINDLAQTYVAGGISNNIIGTHSMLFSTVKDSGVVLQTPAGGSTAALTVMGAGSLVETGGNPTTAYTIRAQPSLIKMKTAADTTDRLLLDGLNRKILMGSGPATNTVGLYWGSGSPEGVITANPTSMYWDYSGSATSPWIKKTGTGNTGWAQTAADKDPYVVKITDAPFNADRTGVVNANAAIAAAHAAVGVTGTVHYPAGTYKTTSTIVMECNVTASADAIISYTGTGVAVQVGTDTSGSLMGRKRIVLPQVLNAAKTVNGWAATNIVGTTGVKVINLVRSIVDVPHIFGFETGLLTYGKGQGTAYTTFNIGSLSSNKVNQMLDADSTGWCNQLTFIGGSWAHGSNELATNTGTRHVVLVDTTGNAEPNNNTWLNPSFESPSVVEYALDVNGSYNMWINPRFEFSGGHSKILWGARAFRNWIWGGNDIDAIQETHTSGGFGNSWLGTAQSHIHPSNSAGWIFENGGSSAYAALTLMRAGGTDLGDDPVTAYTARFQSNAWKGKRATDAFDRLILDPSNGLVQIGDGTAAPTIQWSQGSNTPEGAVTAGVGALYSQNNGALGTTLWVKESGTGNTGWSPMRSTKPRVTSTASSSAPTPNVANVDIYDLSALAAAATFGVPTGTPVDGQSLLIRIKDNGTSRTLAWNAIYRAIGVSLPTATVISKQLYVGCRYNSTATKWDVLAVGVEP